MYGLQEGIRFRFIQRILLPLCVNRVHTPTWENTLFEDALPVVWIFVSFVRVLIDNVKNLENLSNCELGPGKRHFLTRTSDNNFYEVLRVQQLALPDTFGYPFNRKNDTLSKLLLNFCRNLLIGHQKRTNLKGTTLDHADYETTVLINYLSYFFAFWDLNLRKVK